MLGDVDELDHGHSSWELGARSASEGRPTLAPVALASASGSLLPFHDITDHGLEMLLVVDVLDVAALGPPAPLTVLARSNQALVLREAPTSPCFQLLASLLWVDVRSDNDMHVIGPCV